MRLLFLSDTHLGHDLPARPRYARPCLGAKFFENLDAALASARPGDVAAHCSSPKRAQAHRPPKVRVLCLDCIEGATCGPGNFTFRPVAGRDPT